MTLRSDHALLAAWAAGSAGGRTARPLALLEGALGADADAVARWPLGRRDAALLDVLADAFGPHVEATAACRACGEELELEFAVDAVRAPYADSEPVDAGSGLLVRAPTSADVSAALAAGGTEEDAVVRALAALCAGTDPGDPPDDAALAAIGAAVDELDPQADVRLSVACPACGAEGDVAFDVGDYLWRLVEAQVRELIAEVDALARAYGWSEAEVLALPRERRELYLELVGA